MQFSTCVPGVQLKAAPDEVIMGQMRDWNEELQTARELPVHNPQLKLFRDRTLYKVSIFWCAYFLCIYMCSACAVRVL